MGPLFKTRAICLSDIPRRVLSAKLLKRPGERVTFGEDAPNDGYIFFQNDPLNMGMGTSEASAAHPRPNQIWVTWVICALLLRQLMNYRVKTAIVSVLLTIFLLINQQIKASSLPVADFQST